jgi:hypothetical protein
MEKNQIQHSDSFENTVKGVKNKIGKEKLTDDDILLLTAESILYTYTFEEKGYTQDLQ